jgi:hypothetical protein
MTYTDAADAERYVISVDRSIIEGRKEFVTLMRTPCDDDFANPAF